MRLTLYFQQMTKLRQCVSPIVQHPLLPSTIVWASGSELLCYNLGTRTLIFRLKAHTAPILSVSSSISDGKVHWVTAGEDKRILIHRETGQDELSREFEYLHRKKITHAIVDKDVLYFCDMFGEAMSIEYKTGGSVKVLFGHFAVITASMQTSRFFITGDKDAKIRVSRYPDTFEIESFCLGHTSYVSHLSLLDETRLLSASGDGTLKLWDALSGNMIKSVSVTESLICCMHTAGSSTYFVTEDSPRTVKVIDEKMTAENMIDFSTDVQGLFVTGDYIIGVARESGNLNIVKSGSAWMTDFQDLPTNQARCLFYKHGGDVNEESESDHSPVGKQPRL